MGPKTNVKKVGPEIGTEKHDEKSEATQWGFTLFVAFFRAIFRNENDTRIHGTTHIFKLGTKNVHKWITKLEPETLCAQPSTRKHANDRMCQKIKNDK